MMIEVTNLTKKYPAIKNVTGFKEWVVNYHKIPKEQSTFSALKSVNFRVKRGECVGVIGRNGAGKSTLLSLLLGTSVPTSGSILVEGKRTPLLEMGAGFHPDMTGRENIILNAVLLGLTKLEVKDREKEIIDFSEIEEFIDMPVRTYSDGMYMRLAFSIAIFTNPEVFLIDEILAVGDESFQKKSEEALVSLIKSGVTTVFVSHNLKAVEKIANRVLWLDHGELISEGTPETVIGEYLRKIAP